MLALGTGASAKDCTCEERTLTRSGTRLCDYGASGLCAVELALIETAVSATCPHEIMGLDPLNVRLSRHEPLAKVSWAWKICRAVERLICPVRAVDQPSAACCDDHTPLAHLAPTQRHPQRRRHVFLTRSCDRACGRRLICCTSTIDSALDVLCARSAS